MNAKSIWTQQFQSVVNNGRNYSVVIDFHEAKVGLNSDPTSLEICIMML